PAVPPPPHSFPTRRSSDLRSTRDHTVLEPQIWKLLREQSSVPPAAHLPFDFEFPRLQKKLAAPWLSCTKSEEGDFGSYPSTRRIDRKSTRLNSSHVKISYAVFCLKK